MHKNKKIVKVYRNTTSEIPTVVDFFDFEVSEENANDDDFDLCIEEYDDE